jgi:signal peptidase I
MPDHVPANANAPRPHRDSLREALDTIVTVVVVVLLLRTYVAEAFMIPTGSMATTLYGYQKTVVCPQCQFVFPVNCSSERDAQQNPLRRDPERIPPRVTACTCPNCRFVIGIGDAVTCDSGDRVLVAKYLYDWTAPRRLDVVVFKSPETPQVKYDPLNFIKRLAGLPGETIAIHSGNLYVNSDIKYDENPQPPSEMDAWSSEFTYWKSDMNANALKAFEEGKFAIIRKPPDKILSMRRPVYDNDHPAADLVKEGFPARWGAEGEGNPDADFRLLRADAGAAWKAEGDHGFRYTASGDSLAWLRYRHLVVPDRLRTTPFGGLTPETVRPRLITDFLGYNTDQAPHDRPENWVGDLMLECEAVVDALQGQLVLEVVQGVDRFQARFDLAAGECSLVRLMGDKEVVLDKKPVPIKKTGSYRLRFGNIDQRLTLWVDSALPFGDGVDYEAPKESGPLANDLRPAGIGARGASVGVNHISLWRDVYYTRRPGERDHATEVSDWSDPDQWRPLHDIPPATYYVRPGHYFCLGDNSPKSSDSRAWGLVPERLMLGRALVIYFPLGRAGRIR